DAAHNDVSLFLSPEHACAYLPGQTARTIFVNPKIEPRNHIYSLLIQQGFRRSGPYLYRPDCEHCHACVPVRIPVWDFQPDRSQRRAWQQNQNMDIQLCPAELIPEHFALYQRYMAWKHPGSGMDHSSPEDYASFLMGRGGNTLLAEIRLQGDLHAVAVMDTLDNALSAVYTFYAPELPRRSLGTFAILWEIGEARHRGLEWLYLGYWVAASRKMAYKNRFRPFEQLTRDGWKRVP
ncbi:MAG: arginyltransferase, partial [Gammaproteobacteria bacterium]